MKYTFIISIGLIVALRLGEAKPGNTLFDFAKKLKQRMNEIEAKDDKEAMKPLTPSQECSLALLDALDNVMWWATPIEASIQCELGYKGMEPTTLICKDDGQWDGIDEVKSCYRPAQCSYALLHAFDHVKAWSTTPGVVNMQCEDGYEGMGATTVTCNDDGEWEGMDNVKSCTASDNTNVDRSQKRGMGGDLTLEERTNALGSYTFKCNPGYEGDGTTGNCIDVDECATSTHACDALATCTNTVGSYSCACIAPYTGTGFEGQCVDAITNVDGPSNSFDYGNARYWTHVMQFKLQYEAAKACHEHGGGLTTFEDQHEYDSVKIGVHRLHATGTSSVTNALQREMWVQGSVMPPGGGTSSVDDIVTRYRGVVNGDCAILSNYDMDLGGRDETFTKLHLYNKPCNQQISKRGCLCKQRK